MIHWKRYGDYWQAWLGNGLYIRCEKVRVFECYPRKLGGKYVDKWTAKVVAGNVETINVRQWTGGGDGNGNYRTLKEAQAGGLNDAEAVGKAVLDLVERIRSEG
jgi:hypothetical protein